MTERGQTVAAGVFIAAMGVGLIDPRWAWVAGTIGVALATLNCYFLCHAACPACRLLESQ